VLEYLARETVVIGGVGRAAGYVRSLAMLVVQRG
jgi:hypothetical protein